MRVLLCLEGVEVDQGGLSHEEAPGSGAECGQEALPLSRCLVDTVFVHGDDAIDRLIVIWTMLIELPEEGFESRTVLAAAGRAIVVRVLADHLAATSLRQDSADVLLVGDAPVLEFGAPLTGEIADSCVRNEELLHGGLLGVRLLPEATR